MRLRSSHLSLRLDDSDAKKFSGVTTSSSSGNLDFIKGQAPQPKTTKHKQVKNTKIYDEEKDDFLKQ